MTRTSATAVLALVATITFGVGTAAASTDAKRVPANAWAKTVCTGFARWETRLTKLSTRGATDDPAAGKAAITKFLRGAVKATSKLASTVKSAGSPKVTDGQKIATALQSSVKGMRTAYKDARSAAADLSTDDAAAFSLGSQALANDLQTAGITLSTDLADAVQGSALDKAFTDTKACAALT